MDLEQAREIAKMGWPENQKAQRQHDAVDWLIVEVERLKAENAKLTAFARDIRDDYDCDLDAHKYQNDIGCRCCAAEKLLAEAVRP